MLLKNTILSNNHDLPIKTNQPVHHGKVRCVYWLSSEDSQRIISENNFNVAPSTQLAVMVISDRISAFDCVWRGEEGLDGVPGKGAALNTISAYWFDLFKKNHLADHHILATPHPLVWIVQKAEPLKIEAIARQYITGSMWRSYEKGERTFCGLSLPDRLEKNQKLKELLITPSTKGILHNIPGVPAIDDCSISREDIEKNFAAFNFHHINDIKKYEKLLVEGFHIISQSLEAIGQILVDTKFEFGYVHDAQNQEKLIYMDEVGTPDSSRFWDTHQYQKGKVIEQSKEIFRQALLNYIPDNDILTNSSRAKERVELAQKTLLPVNMLMDTSKVYQEIAQKITGQSITPSENSSQEILDVLNDSYSLIK